MVLTLAIFIIFIYIFILAKLKEIRRSPEEKKSVENFLFLLNITWEIVLKEIHFTIGLIILFSSVYALTV